MPKCKYCGRDIAMNCEPHNDKKYDIAIMCYKGYNREIERLTNVCSGDVMDIIETETEKEDTIIQISRY